MLPEIVDDQAFVIVPDANLLLEAYDESSPFHEPAAAWWWRLRSSGKGNTR